LFFLFARGLNYVGGIFALSPSKVLRGKNEEAAPHPVSGMSKSGGEGMVGPLGWGGGHLGCK